MRSIPTAMRSWRRTRPRSRTAATAMPMPLHAAPNAAASSARRESTVADEPYHSQPRNGSAPMSVFVWVMMGIALWHFAVWVPDKFWGGIVGAFVAASIGAVVVGFAIAGFQIIPRHALTLSVALEAVPGAILRLAASWFYGRYLEEPPRRKRTRRPARA